MFWYCSLTSISCLKKNIPFTGFLFPSCFLLEAIEGAVLLVGKTTIANVLGLSHIQPFLPPSVYISSCFFLLFSAASVNTHSQYSGKVGTYALLQSARKWFHPAYVGAWHSFWEKPSSQCGCGLFHCFGLHILSIYRRTIRCCQWNTVLFSGSFLFFPCLPLGFVSILDLPPLTAYTLFQQCWSWVSYQPLSATFLT